MHINNDPSMPEVSPEQDEVNCFASVKANFHIDKSGKVEFSNKIYNYLVQDGIDFGKAEAWLRNELDLGLSNTKRDWEAHGKPAHVVEKDRVGFFIEMSEVFLKQKFPLITQESS